MLPPKPMLAHIDVVKRRRETTTPLECRRSYPYCQWNDESDS